MESYKGKGLETFNNFETLDYGARMYKPSIGRWNVPNPLSETFQKSFTPYHYCLNNPVLNTEPDGRIVPMLAFSAVIVGKGIIVAAIDGGTQYAVNRVQGMTHSEAIDNLDYTSMSASEVIGGATFQGASTTVKKALTVTAVATDALVNSSKKSVANDLTSSNYTPLTASENQTIKTTKSVVNIGAFGLAVNSATSITVGSSGVIKSTIKKHTVSTTITTATTFPPLVYTIPSDNTRVVKPIYVF